MKKDSPYIKVASACISVTVGMAVIISLANQFAECDNFDDASCILDAIAGEEIETTNTI